MGSNSPLPTRPPCHSVAVQTRSAGTSPRAQSCQSRLRRTLRRVLSRRPFPTNRESSTLLARIFPLRLGRQPIGLSSRLRHPRGELLGSSQLTSATPAPRATSRGVVRRRAVERPGLSSVDCESHRAAIDAPPIRANQITNRRSVRPVQGNVRGVGEHARQRGRLRRDLSDPLSALTVDPAARARLQ